MRLLCPAASNFPFLDRPRVDSEKGVSNGLRHPPQVRQPMPITDSQLGLQVTPLVLDLPLRNRDPAGSAPIDDPAPVEAVAAAHGLVVHGIQVPPDTREWRTCRAKANQLRVPGVPTREPPQDSLSEKPLPPHGNQPARVQVPRMQGPQSHTRSTPGRPVPSTSYVRRPPAWAAPPRGLSAREPRSPATSRDCSAARPRRRLRYLMVAW